MLLDAHPSHVRPRRDSPKRPVVLHVTSCFAGGVSRAVRATARATPDHEHRLLADGADLDAARHDSDFTSVERLAGGPLRRLRAVRTAVRSDDAPIVHAHSSWAGVLVRLVAPRGARIVYQPHGYAFERRWSLVAVIAFAVEAVLARRDQCVAVLSPREEHLTRRLHARARTVLVPNAPTLRERVGADGSRGSRRPRIAMIGRACPQKDPDLFVEVVELVRCRVPDLEAVWIGGGDPGAEERLRGAGIEVTGWVEADDLAPLVDRVDVVVHTARYEGFPISVLDASARQVPVVARDIPALVGTPIVRAAGAAGLADTVVACLRDPALARAVAGQGATLLRTMNDETQRSAFAQLYQHGGAAAEAPADR